MLEPRKSRFWRELAPGDDVQAAADGCPDGGCLLLRPGTHTMLVGLLITKPLHLFGRGLATLEGAPQDGVIPRTAVLVTKSATRATLDGLHVTTTVIPGDFDDDSHSACVTIKADQARLQACKIGPAITGVIVRCPGHDDDGRIEPTIINCRWVRGGLNRAFDQSQRKRHYL